MKHYQDYVNAYNELAKSIEGKQGMMIVKRHIYICMNFLEDNAVNAHPADKVNFKRQLTQALSKFPMEEQTAFMKAIAQTIGEV